MNKSLRLILHKYLANYQGITTEMWWRLAVRFLFSYARTAILFLPIYLNRHLHYEVRLIGAVVAAYGLGTVLGSYTGGSITRRFTPRSLSIVGLGLRSVVCVWLVFVAQPLAFALVGLLLGMFDGINNTLLRIDLMHSSEASERLRLNAINRLAINLSAGISSAVGGYLTDLHFHFVVVLSALTSVGAMALTWWLTRSDYHALKNEAKASATTALAIKSKVIMMSFIACILANFCYMQVDSIYPLYVVDIYQVDAAFIGHIFLANALLVVLIEVPLINRLKSNNQLIIAAIGGALIAWGVALVAFKSYLIIGVSVLIWSLGEIIFFSTIFTWLVNHVRLHDRERMIGIYQTLIASGAIIAPAVGGLLYPLLDKHLLWYCCLMIGGLILAIFLYIDKTVYHA